MVRQVVLLTFSLWPGGLAFGQAVGCGEGPGQCGKGERQTPQPASRILVPPIPPPTYRALSPTSAAAVPPIPNSIISRPNNGDALGRTLSSIIERILQGTNDSTQLPPLVSSSEGLAARAPVSPEIVNAFKKANPNSLDQAFDDLLVSSGCDQSSKLKDRLLALQDSISSIDGVRNDIDRFMSEGDSDAVKGLFYGPAKIVKGLADGAVGTFGVLGGEQGKAVEKFYKIGQAFGAANASSSGIQHLALSGEAVARGAEAAGFISPSSKNLVLAGTKGTQMVEHLSRNEIKEGGLAGISATANLAGVGSESAATSIGALGQLLDANQKIGASNGVNTLPEQAERLLASGGAAMSGIGAVTAVTGKFLDDTGLKRLGNNLNMTGAILDGGAQVVDGIAAIKESRDDQERIFTLGEKVRAALAHEREGQSREADQIQAQLYLLRDCSAKQ